MNQRHDPHHKTSVALFATTGTNFVTSQLFDRTAVSPPAPRTIRGSYAMIATSRRLLRRCRRRPRCTTSSPRLPDRPDRHAKAPPDPRVPVAFGPSFRAHKSFARGDVLVLTGESLSLKARPHGSNSSRVSGRGARRRPNGGSRFVPISRPARRLRSLSFRRHVVLKSGSGQLNRTNSSSVCSCNHSG